MVAHTSPETRVVDLKGKAASPASPTATPIWIERLSGTSFLHLGGCKSARGPNADRRRGHVFRLKRIKMLANACGRGQGSKFAQYSQPGDFVGSELAIKGATLRTLSARDQGARTV